MTNEWSPDEHGPLGQAPLSCTLSCVQQGHRSSLQSRGDWTKSAEGGNEGHFLCGRWRNWAFASRTSICLHAPPSLFFSTMLAGGPSPTAVSSEPSRSPSVSPGAFFSHFTRPTALPAVARKVRYAAPGADTEF